MGIVAVFLIYAALPTLGSMVRGALDEATSALLTVAPTVAVVAGISALIMLCIPLDALSRAPRRPPRGV